MVNTLTTSDGLASIPFPSVRSVDEAADLLVRNLPRDQALGLRLIAMARAAAGMHMGAAIVGGEECNAQELPYSFTQAAALLGGDDAATNDGGAA